MKFLNFNYKGQVFDLSHLAPFYCEYIHPASASSDEKIYRCIVEFSGHCFTIILLQLKREFFVLNGIAILCNYRK